ncbi:YjfI family protein [Dyella silvatica]|uniref:YjfI family protein n=1 Tax=Dyella silvatica TaxID=2992128 RepID=UPI00225999F1|nr:DUF2170 family protein [Dyella silvatica]
MKQKGLVPQQVYIRKEHKETLALLEQALRLPVLPPDILAMENEAMSQQWTTKALYDAINATEFPHKEHVTLTLEDGTDPSISLELGTFGDMHVHMAASGEQVFVSTVLCHASQVSDRAGFNDACLRLNPMNPLSNLGITSMGGEDIYIIFGELSSRSPLSNIIEEIMVLAHNTIRAAHELQSFIH